MESTNFWLFAVTALLLNLTPGNDMLYVAARSTAQGTKAGIISALGIMAGCMVHIFAAVIGLSALLAKSALAFTIIKYVGAGYLIYLGVRAILSKQKTIAVQQSVKPLPLRKIFWQGAFTNVLNPKVALFFLAFLPQFLNPHSNHTAAQIFFLGTWFNIGGTLVNMLVALLFGKIGGWLSRSPRFIRWQERLTGLVLIALGIKVAAGSNK